MYGPFQFTDNVKKGLNLKLLWLGYWITRFGAPYYRQFLRPSNKSPAHPNLCTDLFYFKPLLSECELYEKYHNIFIKIRIKIVQSSSFLHVSVSCQKQGNSDLTLTRLLPAILRPYTNWLSMDNVNAIDCTG